MSKPHNSVIYCRHVWGPGAGTTGLGISPINWKYGTIETENGEAEGIFTCTQPVRKMCFSHELFCTLVKYFVYPLILYLDQTNLI